MATTDHVGDLRRIAKSAFNFRTQWLTASTGLKALLDDCATSAAADDDGRIAAMVKDARVMPRQLVRYFDRHAPLGLVKLQQLAAEIDRSDIASGAAARILLGTMLREEMLDQGYRFVSRGVTNSAPAADAGNTGDGVLVMLSKDEDGFELEAVYNETIKFKCVTDKHGGALAGQERWRAYGERRGAHALADGGSGADTTFDGAWDSTAISNATFGNNTETDANFNASSSTSKLNAWTINTDAGGAATNVKSSTGSYFRELVSGTPRSILLDASGPVVEQEYTYQGDAPVLVAIAVNKNLGAAIGGSARLRVGAKSATLALTSMGTGWEWLRITAWPSELKGSSALVRFDWQSRTSGDLYFGPVVFRAMTFVGGKWFGLLPGETDWIEGDLWTQQSTIPAFDSGSLGKYKDTLHLLYGTGFELPHAAVAVGTNFGDW